MSSKARIKRFRAKLYEPGNEEQLRKYKENQQKAHKRYREKVMSNSKTAKLYRQKIALQKKLYRAKKALSDPKRGEKNLEKLVKKTGNNTKIKLEVDEEKIPNAEVIKVEPTFDFLPETDEDFVTLCRCCFKSTPVSQDADLTVLSAFEEVIQMNLEPNEHASTFCKICCDQIKNLRDFRRLAIAKQNKFCETLITGSLDFSNLSQMTILDPLDTFIKEEPEDIKIMDFHDDFYPRVELFRLDEEEIKKLSNHVDVPDVRKKSRKRKYSKETCPICHKSYTRVQKHINRVHLKIKNLTCDLCSYRSFSKDEMEGHMTKHESNKNLQCYTCGYTTDSIARFKTHEKKHKETQEIEDLPKPSSKLNAGERFKCEICGLDIKSLYYLNYHKRRKHDRIFEFSCEECKKEFFTKQELKIHVENKHSGRKFICETCGKVNGTYKAFQNHQLSHYGNNFVCYICEKKFLLKTRLKRHMRSFHLKERNFKCEKCEKSYFSRPELILHMNTHNNIRFYCFLPGCTSSASRRDGLVTHMRSHRLTGPAMEDYMRQLNDYCDELKKSGKATKFT